MKVRGNSAEVAKWTGKDVWFSKWRVCLACRKFWVQKHTCELSSLIPRLRKQRQAELSPEQITSKQTQKPKALVIPTFGGRRPADQKV